VLDREGNFHDAYVGKFSNLSSTKGKGSFLCYTGNFLVEKRRENPFLSFNFC
jgi:hypothetical protein